MAEATTTTDTEATTNKTTPEAAVKTPGVGAEGAATQTAATTEAGKDAATTAPSAEDEQARIDTIVKKRLAEERARQEKLAKEQNALAEGKYQELLTEREKDLQAAKSELMAARLENNILAVAATLGVTNTNALTKLIKDEVEYDEQGRPTNVERLAKAAIKDVPGLVGQTGTTTVPISPNNPAKTEAAQTGPVTLYSPGLFKS